MTRIIADSINMPATAPHLAKGNNVYSSIYLPVASTVVSVGP